VHVDQLLRRRNDRNWQPGLLAKRMLATGGRDYRDLFSKLVIMGLRNARYPLGREDQRVLQRAMNVGTGSAGGFAVPFQLDNTIVPTSNLSINPFRRIARQELITSNEWRVPTSPGGSAGYAAEATEASDNSATPLAQPAFVLNRAEYFVPVSRELDQDTDWEPS
jgi:HK97 family phage major capsid protein